MGQLFLGTWKHIGLKSLRIPRYPTLRRSKSSNKITLSQTCYASTYSPLIQKYHLPPKKTKPPNQLISLLPLPSQLLANSAVQFAGYKVPHPLEPSFQLKIQTDGSIPPTDALEKAANELIGMLTIVENNFKREFSFREVEGGGADGMGGIGGTGAQGRQGQGEAGAGAYGEEGAWSTRDYLDL